MGATSIEQVLPSAIFIDSRIRYSFQGMTQGHLIWGHIYLAIPPLYTIITIPYPPYPCFCGVNAWWK